MAGHETSFTNAELTKRLDGLSARSVRIARCSQSLGRLSAFMDIYVNQPTLTFGDNGRLRQYGYSDFSGIGTDGTLVHIRNEIGAQSPSDKVIVVGSMHFDDVAFTLAPQVDRTIGHDGRFKMTALLDTVPSSWQPSQTEDEPDEVRDERELAEWLAYDTERIETPALVNANNEWSFSRGRSFELLNDIRPLDEQVREAVRRGFGAAAALGLQLVPTPTDTGHFEQKVVA